jgi:Wiskott-Aldrich syndrome protein
MSKAHERFEHVKSKRFNDTENESIIQLIKKENGLSLANAVVQLWISQKPSHTMWTKVSCGIVFFIKDFKNKSYFFRLFNLVPAQLWEQEMYTPFSYFQLSQNFHHFPAEDCNVGFNFAFEDEADNFFTIVNQKIMLKREKQLKKISKLHTMAQITSDSAYCLTPTSQSNLGTPLGLNLMNSFGKFTDSAHTTLKKKIGNFGKKSRKTCFDKTQISAPTTGTFVHVGHVGLTDSHNIDVKLCDEVASKEMQEKILMLLNVPIKINEETEKFIDTFIKEHGGNDKFNAEIERINSPAAQPDANRQNKVSIQLMRNKTSSENAKVVPPIPQTIPPALSVNHHKMSSSIPNILEKFVIPPPPPPLSLTSILANPSNIPRPPPPPPPPQPPAISLQNSISATKTFTLAPQSLLDSIKEFDGFKSKTAPQTINTETTCQPTTEPTILDQLKSELLKRAQFLNDSDEDSSESDGSESEWS